MNAQVPKGTRPQPPTPAARPRRTRRARL